MPHVHTTAATGAPPRPGSASLLAGSLEWRRLGWSRREWELRAEGQRIGGLVIRRALREHARLDGPSGAWDVRRHLWSGSVELTQNGCACVHCQSRPFTRDLVQCAAGSRFEWGRPAWWKTEWHMFTESGFPVVSFRACSPLRGTGYTIQISDMGRRVPELETLILLGGYLLARTRGRAY